MKTILSFFLSLWAFSVLAAQTDCTVKIVYSMNKTNPPSYTFKTENQADGAKYYWYFGDNTSSDAPAPTHTYKKTDTYLIQLKVVGKDNIVCYGELKGVFEGEAVNTIVTTLTGKGKVKEMTSTAGCKMVIVMENGSVLVPVEMVPVFEFKDGQYIELAYELQKDKVSGCSAGVSARILKIAELNPSVACKVPITISKNSTNPMSYSFKTNNQPDGTKYYWYFGDNTTSDGPAPTHSYKTGDTYLVQLKVVGKDNAVCYGELKGVFEGGAVIPPATTFTGKGVVKNLSSTAGCGLVISSENGLLIPAKIATDFLLKEGQSVEFTYEKYAEKVTGCKEGTDIRILAIKEITTTAVCKASFSATNKIWSDPAMLKKMVFTNLSTGDIKACKWNFGDNTTSTELKPTHEYAAFGEYKVCLSITTIAGCTSEYCTSVKVENFLTTNTCKFDLIIKPREATLNTFLFYAISTAEIKSVKWSFGDNTTSDAKNPEHTYEKPGDYQVACTIVTTSGCTQTNTIKHSVVASSSLSNCKGPINLLLYDPTESKCNGSATVKLLDEAGKEITTAKFLWSDGRSGSSVGNLCPEKLYTVQALIENVCQKKTSFTLLSVPIWRASTVNGKSSFMVISPMEGIEYEWHFGNGIVLKGTEVSYDFEKDGVYEVKLKAVSINGSSEYSQPVSIVKTLTGIEIVNQSDLVIYPNPVKEILRIDFGTPPEGNPVMEIVDLKGRSVMHQQLNNDGSSHADVNIQQLKSGIYLLRITNGQKLIADRKFIKAD
jgi:PKD repeat protein